MVDFNNPRNRLNKQHAIYFEYKNLENERETGLFTEIYETVLTEIFSYKKYDSFLRKLGVLWFYWKLPGLSITKQL
jgi:hypothetical protein